MSLPDEEITKLHKVRRTLFEMLRDRGYEVEDSEINMTRKEFIEKYNGDIRREGLTILKSKPLEPKPENTDQEKQEKKQIYVFFPDDLKIGVKIIKTYVVRMEQEKIYSAIIVVRHGLTPSAKACQTEIAQKFDIEVFQEAELVVNIRYHFQVPEHRPMSKEEKKALLDQYRLKEAQLPRILQSDPIARYYGLKKREVVKILRPIETGTSEKDKDDFDSTPRNPKEEICYVTYRIVS